MPDAAWAVNGSPPGSSQDKPAALVSTSTHAFRHVHGRGLSSIAHLPDPHLTRSQPRLFPRRSPQRSSANADVGGLKPPPAGRLQRANLYLFYSTAVSRTTINHRSTSCVRVHNRFSRMETPYMRRFFDRAGSTNGSRIAPPAMLPSA